jgi:MFS family permease
MAFQTTGLGVSLWRLIAGIGIGVELVTIDTYLSELVPKSMRGRAFAFNQGVQFRSFRSWPLSPSCWSRSAHLVLTAGDGWC